MIINQGKKDLDQQFEKFYAINFPRVKNFAKSLTKSEEDAEDIAQNIFLRLWMSPELWKEGNNMKNYLYTATRNEIFNLFKHERIKQDFADNFIKEQLINELSNEDTHLLNHLYYKEILMIIRMALAQMPAQRRQVFEMSRFKGLSHKEIAEKLQIPIRTVENHIYRALVTLRKTLIIVICIRLIT